MLDLHFYFREIEACNIIHGNALKDFDDGRPLNMHNFLTDGFDSKDALINPSCKRLLSYRYRHITESYTQAAITSKTYARSRRDNVKVHCLLNNYRIQSIHAQSVPPPLTISNQQTAVYHPSTEQSYSLVQNTSTEPITMLLPLPCTTARLET